MLFHLWASLRGNTVEGWPPEQGVVEETVQVTSAPQTASVHCDTELQQEDDSHQFSLLAPSIYLFL